MAVAQFGYQHLVHLLLSRGAVADARTAEGENALAIYSALLKARFASAPRAPPMMGATQKSHSWPTAQLPT
jgi:hypothetical protein